MPKLSPSLQVLPIPPQSIHSLKEARREEQKTTVNETNCDSAPPNNLRPKTKSAGGRDDPKPTGQEEKSDIKRVEVGNGQGNDPAKVSADLINRWARKPTPRGEFSGDQLEVALEREEIPKAESLEDRKNGGREPTTNTG